MPRRSSRDAIAIERARCPKCRARKGQPCTYVNDRTDYEWDDTSRTGWRRVYLHRAGEPTKVCHNERRLALWRLEMKEARAEREARVFGHRPAEITLAAQAIRRDERIEQARLGRWLAVYGEIFVTTVQFTP